MRATNVLAVDLARENEALRAENERLARLLASMTPLRIALGDLEIDIRHGVIFQHGERVGGLTRVETRLFTCLVRETGEVVPYERIGAEVWPGMTGLELVHCCQVNLSRMRAKIDRSKISQSSSRHFRVVAGVGVALVP